jgi:uncharacterized membrane protein YfcA
MNEFASEYYWIIISSSFFLAGIVKGTLGLGLPTTAITILTFFLPPLDAVMINVIPVLILNSWQYYQAEDHLFVVRKYWRLAAWMIASLAVFSFVTVHLSSELIKLWIGVGILSFLVTNLRGSGWYIRPEKMRICGPTVLWAIPLTIYLIAAKIPKREFVDTMGFLLLVGCMPVLFGYLSTEVLVLSEIWFPSIVATLVATMGFVIGQSIREKISTDLFRNLLLWMFFIMGMRMIVEAIL